MVWSSLKFGLPRLHFLRWSLIQGKVMGLLASEGSCNCPGALLFLPYFLSFSVPLFLTSSSPSLSELPLFPFPFLSLPLDDVGASFSPLPCDCASSLLPCDCASFLFLCNFICLLPSFLPFCWVPFCFWTWSDGTSSHLQSDYWRCWLWPGQLPPDGSNPSIDLR